MKKIGLLFIIFSLQLFAATTYTWNQTGSAAWTTAANWTPTRTTPATDDILLFNNGATITVTAVPTQTIGSLQVSANTTVNLQTGAASTLSIGGAGTTLTIASGSTLNSNGTFALTVAILTGAKGSVSGNMTFSGAAHKITAVDASGLTFQNGSIFSTGTGFSSNPYGTTSLNSVVFSSGSKYVYGGAGSNPFGASQPSSVVVFQTGSTYSHQATATSQSPAFSGRTYSNFEYISSFSNSGTGSAACSMDNLLVQGTGTLGIGLTGTFNVNGNITVSTGATLNLNPASAAVVTFNGSTNQTITNSGTLTFFANQGVTINNSNGVTLNSPITILGPLTLTNGLVTTTATNLLTLGAAATVSGGSATSFVNGPVCLTARTTSAMVAPVGKGAAYRPVTATLGSLSGSGTLTIEQIEGPTTGTVTATGNPVLSYARHFHIAQTGLSSANVDLTLSWGSDDGISNPSTLTIAGSSDGGLTWPYARQAPYISYTGVAAAGTVTASSFTLTSLPSGDCALGSFSGNPMPVSLSAFSAVASNGAMKLSWKTSVETENHGFNIERSADKSVWATLAFIQGQGNSNTSKAYAYSDNSISKAGKYYYRLKQIDNNGSFIYSNIAEADFVLPTVYSLNQNYPNPFNPNTMISYSLPVASNVKISVYNAIGETIQILENGFKGAGNYSVSFNASNVPSGIYFYRIDAGTFTQVRKMMLLK